MDPITTAVVAAISAGLTASASKMGENLTTNAYDILKTALRKRFGGGSEVAKAVDQLEAQPESVERRAALEQRLAEADATHDPSLRALAEVVTQFAQQPADGTAQAALQAVAQLISQHSGNAEGTADVRTALVDRSMFGDHNTQNNYSP